MGARFESSHGEVRGTVPGGRLVGTRVVLEYPSHTATDNLLMAAVLAKGTTVIENAAKEPEVADLAAMLCDMGAVVRGAGTSRIEIEGVDELRPTRHTVVPDRVVAATYLAAVGMAGGEVTIAGRPARAHGDGPAEGQPDGGRTPRWARTGCAPARRSGSCRPTSPRSRTPGWLPTTARSSWRCCRCPTAWASSPRTSSPGASATSSELRRMGADIRTEGHHAVVRGVPRLSGAPVRAPDIRAGVALVLAGLVAEGETVVSGAHHIRPRLRGPGGCAALARGQGDHPVSPPRPADPAALLEQARGG